MDATNFGQFLRDLRQARNLTIHQVELYCVVSNSYISLLENGKRNIPSVKILKKLSQMYKVPFEELLQKAGYIDEIDDTQTTTTLKGSDLPPELQGIVDEIVVDTKALLEEGIPEGEIAEVMEMAKKIIQMQQRRKERKDEFLKGLKKKKDD